LKGSNASLVNPEHQTSSHLVSGGSCTPQLFLGTTTELQKKSNILHPKLTCLQILYCKENENRNYHFLPILEITKLEKDKESLNLFENTANLERMPN